MFSFNGCETKAKRSWFGFWLTQGFGKAEWLRLFAQSVAWTHNSEHTTLVQYSGRTPLHLLNGRAHNGQSRRRIMALSGSTTEKQGQKQGEAALFWEGHRSNLLGEGPQLSGECDSRWLFCANMCECGCQVCVCVCVCMKIYIYIYMYTCVSVCLSVCVWAFSSRKRLTKPLGSICLIVVGGREARPCVLVYSMCDVVWAEPRSHSRAG